MSREANYFSELLKAHYEELEQKQPELIVFGTGFPVELIYAVTGKMPLWVLGGSRLLQEASDDAVPRDTDPVTRAALGALLANEGGGSEIPASQTQNFGWKERALVIIPCASDAQRKAVYLLQSRGWKTVTVWIPGVKDSFSHRSYQSELEHALQAICIHTGKRCSAGRLKKAIRYFQEIRQEHARFQEAAGRRETEVPDHLRLTVPESFFAAEDIDEWRRELQQLTDEILQLPEQRSSSPRVLLVGSPILFPNDKVPDLLRDAGVVICGYVTGSTGIWECEGAEAKDMRSLAYRYFEQDTSSAFVQNDALQAQLRRCVAQEQPDGIVWHVLKGQIEYDFELRRCEEYLEQECLPVIRLETDYQYQDIEQLRIRIEAFAELLAQKKKERHNG